jgi:hypothetical protein
MHLRLILAAALAVGLSSHVPAQAQSVQALPACGTAAVPTGPGNRLYTDLNGSLCINGGGSSGGSPSNPSYTTPAGVTRTRQTCTLPAYATGGNIVCTNEVGQQTTTACAANTACLVSAANASRKTAYFTNRTAGTTIDVGYSATVAPGNANGVDGPSVTNGQGGNITENPAHVGAYYAASAAASTLVFVQGQ